MAINDTIVLDFPGNQRVPVSVIFEGDYESKHNNWQDTVAVAKADNGLYIALCNRMPISNPVPKGVAFSAVTNHIQMNMQ